MTVASKTLTVEVISSATVKYYEISTFNTVWQTQYSTVTMLWIPPLKVRVYSCKFEKLNYGSLGNRFAVFLRFSSLKIFFYGVIRFYNNCCVKYISYLINKAHTLRLHLSCSRDKILLSNAFTSLNQINNC